MASEPRKCPYCGMSMAADQRTCPDCGNPYPFDDESGPPPPASSSPFRPQRPASVAGRGPASAPEPAPSPRTTRTAGATAGGFLAAIAPYRTALVLVGVLFLIVIVAYLLFTIVMAYFGERRPDPSIATPVAGPVIVPTLTGSPVVGASPSPGTGTAISPPSSPSPVASVRMKVANTDGQGANMRQRPSTSAPVLRTLAEGTVVETIGGDTNAEGRNWRNIRETSGQTGWVASELLAPE